MINKDAIIIGAGGHARSLISVIESMGFNIKAFFDKNNSIKGFGGIKNFGDYNPNSFIGANVFMGIGNINLKKKLIKKITHSFGMAIDKTAIVDSDTKLGEGVQVFPGSVLNRKVIIGNHSIINTRAIIEHDSKLGSFVHVAPGAVICGSVIIGNETLIGANSTVLPDCIIGNNVTIGAGSVVTKSIPNNSVVFGVPARLKY